MALTLDTFKGLKNAYFKILKVEQTYIDNKSLIKLGLYTSKEVRDGNVNDFLNVVDFIVDGTDLNREELYKKIKEAKIQDGKIENPFSEAKSA